MNVAVNLYFNGSNHAYFHIYPLGQTFYCYRFPGGKIAIKIGAVHFVYVGKEAHITQKNVGFYHMLKCKLRLAEYSAQVFHYLVGFFFYTAHKQLAAAGVKRYLATDKQ